MTHRAETIAKGVVLHCGDCLDVLTAMPDASVDSCVTDPPYGLEFMGKEWDKFTEAPRRIQGTGGREAPFAHHAVKLDGSRGKNFQAFSEAWAREGMRAVLIEREAEYQADIRRRMALVLGGPDERQRAALVASGRAQGHDDLPLFATPPRPTVGEPGYVDGSDFAGSISDGFRAVRDRMTAGGKPWNPK